MAGGVFFNENDFFTCSSGLFPAQFASTSQSKNYSNDVKFLTVQDKVCRKQDFSCKWIVVLAAAIAALCVTGVGAMLVAALVGACIGLGLAMTLCGSMASMARSWLQPKTDVLIGGHQAVTMREGPLMTCSLFGGNILPAPNVKHQWQAILLGSGATLMAGLEGFMYATAFRGAGTLLKSPATFFSNIGGNYLMTLGKWGLAGRAAFAGYGAINEHYIGGENDGGKLGETAARGFLFEFDMADRWMHGKGSIQDIALIFSMGGIPVPPKAGNKNAASEPENNAPKDEGNPLARAGEEAETNNSGGKDRAHEDMASPRYGERRISDDLYNELRDKTPTQEIRDLVNKDVNLPMEDPALPGKMVTKNLHADHVVSMDKIARMEGFDRLTKEQQLQVLNNPENFVGLSESANTSKGAKSFDEWTLYKKENIPVDPEFRRQMMEKEVNTEKILQQQIDDFNKPKNP
jgi:hypothetical protein